MNRFNRPFEKDSGGRGGFQRGGGGGGQRGPRINRMIRVPKVRLIGSDGAQLGIFTTDSAMRMAQEEGMDLVEISPTADPPVCRIMDYGKFKYQQQKKQQEAKKKQTVTVVKEIKLRPNTDDHDIGFKMKHVRRFLEEKDKVKITMQFRGREMMFADRGKQILDKICADFADIADVEGHAKREGRTMFIILSPRLPGAKKNQAAKGLTAKPTVKVAEARPEPVVEVIKADKPLEEK